MEDSKVANIVTNLENKEPKTKEEIEALKAYSRLRKGSVIVAIVLVVVVAVAVFVCVGQLSSLAGLGVKRYGEVTQDGMIRYIQDNTKYVSLEEVGLDGMGMSPGDDVILFFDNVTDELTSAYIREEYEKAQNIPLRNLFGSIFVVVIGLILFRFVICDRTPFGSAWYKYIKVEKQKQQPDLPRSVNVAISIVSVVLALLICAPEISNLVSNVRELQRITNLSTAIDNANKAGNEASKIADALDDMFTETVEPEAIEQFEITLPTDTFVSTSDIEETGE